MIPQSVAPVLSLVLATGIALLPWPGAGGTGTLVAAFVPAIVVHYWTLRRMTGMPPSAAFLSGLTIDVLGGGALGFCALLNLVGWWAGVGGRPWKESFMIGRWGLAAGTLVVMMAVGWLAASLALSAPSPAGEMLAAGLWVALLYPLIALPLRLLDDTRRRGIGSN